MSSVVVSGDVSGAITLAAPSVAGTNTITLPAATGTALTTAGGQTISGTTTVSTLNATTIQVGGNLAVNGPAFSAYLSSNQSITSSVWTKVQFNTEEFDTNSNYDNATNYRFTPTVAGYYQVNASISASSSSSQTRSIIAIYKNGSEFKRGNYLGAGYNSVSENPIVSALIYLNGSTDYVEVYGYITGTTNTFGGVSAETYFQASLVRGA